ncbi:MAG: transcriptional repressor [Planctomycetes bacterium]|nr:transcriptional repressor [Planctomycetota bacterium]
MRWPSSTHPRGRDAGRGGDYDKPMEFTERARQILRKSGLRMTITRTTLVAAMLESHEPVSMDDAVRLCGHNGGDPATIYRNLQALSEAGILQQVRGVGRREMFELSHEHPVDEAQGKHHHAHLSCTKCGRVECIDLKDLPHKPPAPEGWKLDDVTVTVWGLCPDCR